MQVKIGTYRAGNGKFYDVCWEWNDLDEQVRVTIKNENGPELFIIEVGELLALASMFEKYEQVLMGKLFLEDTEICKKLK